jgi:hypothetical protein
MASRPDLSGIDVARGPHVSATEKRRYWRAVSPTVQVWLSTSRGSHRTISVQHERLESDDVLEHWRTYWKDVLQDV